MISPVPLPSPAQAADKHVTAEQQVAGDVSGLRGMYWITEEWRM